VPEPQEPDAGPAVSLDEIDRAQCLELLGTTSLGRVAFLVEGRPVILPVNYAVDGETIVFRTAEETVLNQVALQAVAFEVDRIDETSRTGWSVLAQGVAQDVSQAIDTKSERLRALALVSWAPGQRHRWFGIKADVLTGRRLR